MHDPRSPHADPKAYFIHAQRFYACELAIMNEGWDQEVRDFTAPGAVVLSAFAAELFLKCLGVLETGRVNRTHNLKTLFKNLSRRTRKLVEREWDQILAGKKHLLDDAERNLGIQIPRELSSALDVGANCFEALRYPERAEAIFFLTDFPHALMETIIALKPEWLPECSFRVPKPGPDSKAFGAVAFHRP